MPLAHTIPLLVAVFVTLCFHELGHALAGANENQMIEAVAVLFQVFLPAAYVRFAMGGFMIKPWNQLKIYCAGAYHNIVMFMVAVVLVATVSSLVAPFYQVPQGGALVQRVLFYEDDSLVKFGDKITGINQCDVKSEEDWVKCLSGMIYDPNVNSNTDQGNEKTNSKQDLLQNDDKRTNLEYQNSDLLDPACIESSEIPNLTTECCEETYEGPIPCWKVTPNHHERDDRLVCKPAKEVWKWGFTPCEVYKNADDPQSIHGTSICPIDPKTYDCLVPHLKSELLKTGHRLIQIRLIRPNKQSNQPEQHMFHMYRRPYELLHQFSFSKFVPRWKWMPTWSANWADYLNLFIQYLANFNLVTAFITMLPVFYFDGYYAVDAITVMINPRIEERKRDAVVNFVATGTSVFGGLLLLFMLYDMTLV